MRTGAAFFGAWAVAVAAWGQIPDAPPVPVCNWDSASGQIRSTCKFKDALSGTTTSIAGHRVILFDRTVSGGHGTSRQFLRDALTRLQTRYGFDLVMTQDPNYFTAANLANAKAVIFSNGDGDVIPAGTNRVTLENFVQLYGWGLITIHSACAFITSGWPFLKTACVQEYYTHNPSGTQRDMYLDSGTTVSPIHGVNNPQSEFLLRRPMPGTWGNSRELRMADEFHSFRASARATAGVNVLFGYDETSGTASTPMGDHPMIWNRLMGKGLALNNSWGHDLTMYTGYGNFGDSLLWRFIRYVAKDWCVAGSGEPGCDLPVPVFKREIEASKWSGAASGGRISVSLMEPGNHTVTVTDVKGKQVYAFSATGPGKVEIAGLGRGLYFVRVGSGKRVEARKVLAH